MKVNGINYHSIWAEFDKKSIFLIDQTALPFEFVIKSISNVDQLIDSIKKLEVRGAPALGIAAAFGIWLSFALNEGKKEKIENDFKKIISSRPTAVNLMRGANFVYNEIKNKNLNDKEVYEIAKKFADNEINSCRLIGLNGVSKIEEIYKNKKDTVNILTHCNAGWLACGDFGTALAPIYEAHNRKIPIHVFVDETRPLNQGSRITAWELDNANIEFDIISDNLGGLLMMKSQIDLVIVGADRIANNGDVANKVGTYLKALAAKEHKIPFLVAAPLSTFDFSLENGLKIPIEKRNENELRLIKGKYNNKIVEIALFPERYNSLNYAFDITPEKFISQYITEIGCYKNIEELKKVLKIKNEPKI